MPTDEELIQKVRQLESGIADFEKEGDEEDIELQDVVNSKGQVIGILPRKVIWDNGLERNTMAVDVFVLDEAGRVLVPVRSEKKRKWPGCFDYSCGENLKSGENFETAVVRGLKEELGVENVKLEEKLSLSPYTNEGEYCFVKVYVAKIVEMEEMKINPEEIRSIEIMGIDEIKKLTIEKPEQFKRGYPEVFRRVFG